MSITFDADGQVIHLVPNSFDPLKRHDPKAVTEIGGGELDITIGPPFGQEIAVALRRLGSSLRRRTSHPRTCRGVPVIST